MPEFPPGRTLGSGFLASCGAAVLNLSVLAHSSGIIRERERGQGAFAFQSLWFLHGTITSAPLG